MKKLLRRWLEGAGYTIRRLPESWSPWGGRLTTQRDAEFERVFALAEPDPLHRSRLKDETTSKICRCWMLKSLLQTLLPTAHDVAECGVNRGLSAYVIATYLSKSGFAKPREFQLYDSFEGLPTPDARHDDAAIPAGAYTTPSEHVARHLGEFPFVAVHPGWIPASLAPAAERTFSFVHLDLNVYQAYRDALEFFWSRMSVPGLIVCDDYGFATSRGAKQAIDEFGKSHQVHVVYLPTGQALLCKFQ